MEPSCDQIAEVLLFSNVLCGVVMFAILVGAMGREAYNLYIIKRLAQEIKDLRAEVERLSMVDKES